MLSGLSKCNIYFHVIIEPLSAFPMPFSLSSSFTSTFISNRYSVAQLTFSSIRNHGAAEAEVQRSRPRSESYVWVKPAQHRYLRCSTHINHSSFLEIHLKNTRSILEEPSNLCEPSPQSTHLPLREESNHTSKIRPNAHARNFPTAASILFSSSPHRSSVGFPHWQKPR